ncbi:TetR/AcrR family transcriptional regulator [Cryptosporangium minutisporangium]|uniref:HTH tetR-type domain-containing protein n=1 Tax=Cryptosporangium minutisporangium TaxID=113569 RepID=A0ABP6SYS1_9ACTN
MSLTSARRARVRTALLDAAERLFATNGYGATTVTEIAVEAGVSRPTAFRYFPTKADYVFAVQDEWREALQRVVAEEPATGWVLVQRVCAAVVELIERDTDRVLAAYRLAMAEPSLAQAAAARDRAWTEAMAQLLASDVPREEDALLGGAAIMGMINMAILRWAESGAATDLGAVIAHGLDLLHDGLGSGRDDRRIR